MFFFSSLPSLSFSFLLLIFLQLLLFVCPVFCPLFFLFPVFTFLFLRNISWITFTSQIYFREGSSSHKKVAFPFVFSFWCVVFLRSFCTLQLALTYSLAFWPLECLLHIEFYSKIRDFYFRLWSFFLSSDLSLLLLRTFVLFNWIQHPSVCLTSWMPSPIEFTLFRDIFLVFDSAFRPSYFPFQALYSSRFSFVWTSGLSFCLIILVFARMSLRVNFTARWFLMIIHCLLGQRSGWGGRHSEFFNKKITVIHIIW